MHIDSNDLTAEFFVPSKSDLFRTQMLSISMLACTAHIVDFYWSRGPGTCCALRDTQPKSTTWPILTLTQRGPLMGNRDLKQISKALSLCDLLTKLLECLINPAYSDCRSVAFSRQNNDRAPIVQHWHNCLYVICWRLAPGPGILRCRRTN